MDLFMEFKDEDGVKYDSFDSDLEKCIVSFTRQGPLKEETGLEEKTVVGLEMGYSIRSSNSDAK